MSNVGVNYTGGVSGIFQDELCYTAWHCRSCDRRGREWYFFLSERNRLGLGVWEGELTERIAERHSRATSGICPGVSLRKVILSAERKAVQDNGKPYYYERKEISVAPPKGEARWWALKLGLEREE